MKDILENRKIPKEEELLHGSPIVHLILDSALTRLSLDADGRASLNDVTVELVRAADGLEISIEAKETPVCGLHLRWPCQLKPGTLFMNDAWGRSEFELAWRTLEPERNLPWYFLWNHDGMTGGIGARTDARSLVSFNVDPEGLSLYLDTRNGGSGVALNKRHLKLATIIEKSAEGGQTPWQVAREFAKQLAVESPNEIDHPIYGCNNWYYTYGKIDRDGVLSDCERTVAWAGNAAKSNRPYMLIDDGWQVAHCDGRYNGGPWHACNRFFDDMAGLAERMSKIGVRPGLWYRPLTTLEGAMEPYAVGHGQKPAYAQGGFNLDPTFPETRQRIVEDAQRIADWGFEMIKHDFTTVDLLGSWACGQDAQAGTALPARGWTFHDQSKTNAEIVRDLYATIKAAAGGALIIGCQTIGHLGVGTLDLQRVGGDVDGRDWARTRRMGPNSLAFRMHQHDIFYQIDADCAPITPQLPWELSSQWLDLLARSGTPLFVSADPASLNKETEQAIRDAFSRAAKPQPLPVALDWMHTPTPRHWRVGSNETVEYRWAPLINCPPKGLIEGDSTFLIDAGKIDN